MIAKTTDLDNPLPNCHVKGTRGIVETFLCASMLTSAFSQDLCCESFACASELVVVSVAFSLAIERNSITHIGIAYGKSNIAPKHDHSIPRLKFCAAMLAVEVGEMVY